MFRQIKSALLWVYLYKFRKALVKIGFVALFITLLLFMYSDIVEYLQLSNQIDYLPYVIFFKWFSVFLGIIYIVYTIVSLKKDSQKKTNALPKEIDNKKRLTKRDIAQMADEIIQRKLNKR